MIERLIRWTGAFCLLLASSGAWAEDPAPSPAQASPAETTPAPAPKAAPPCPSLEEKPVKIEGWINREHRKHHRAIAKEFTRMKHTRASIKVFPMGQTAKVVAVGRCVPAYIARDVLEKSLKYTGGIESLVNQAFLPPHWIGIGTTQFDEPSQQTVTPDQVRALLDPNLNDEEFHALYRKFSVQDDTVKYFGRTTSNAKKVD